MLVGFLCKTRRTYLAAAEKTMERYKRTPLIASVVSFGKSYPLSEAKAFGFLFYIRGLRRNLFLLLEKRRSFLGCLEPRCKKDEIISTDDFVFCIRLIY